MKRKSGNRIFTVILILIFIAGVCVLCYPFASDIWNSRVQSYAITAYDETVGEMTEEDYSSVMKEAEQYNSAVMSAGSQVMFGNPDRITGYEDLLNINGDGIMGYITIDKLNIELPIYHGTSSDVLSKGAGHMEGSSLPIGGNGTHTVISAHRGLPTSRLFTNLDEMEIGDYFKITVLDEELWYEVDQILTVLPDEMESLYMEEGKDLCTLLTCTPYGINTHRLLVRGHRTEAPTEDELDSTFFNWRMAVLIDAVILVLAVIVFCICVHRYRKNRR